MADQQYWASKPSKEAVKTMLEKVQAYDMHLDETGRILMCRRALDTYYGMDPDGGVGTAHKIGFGGEQGETMLMRLNHFRSIVDQKVVMATGQRPSYDAMALNADYKAAEETELAENIFEYELSVSGLEDCLKDACKRSRLTGEGWVGVFWDPNDGDVYEADQSGLPIRTGKPKYRTFSMYDIARDVGRIDMQHDWLAARTWVNKWDLAASYPEHAQEIINMGESPSPANGFMGSLSLRQFKREARTDLIEVIEFFHKKTPAIPDGRYIKCVGDIPLFDGPLPYQEIPLFCLAEDIESETCFGSTKDWDLLAPQKALDGAISTVVTNHEAFGVQNIIVPRGADLNVEDLGGGLRMIEANTSGGEPKPLQLLATGEHSYRLLESLQENMETISGVNSVARGNPAASLKSGSALAAVQSMAVQANSGLTAAYIRFMEAIGTAVIKLYQSFASVPHLIEVVGVDKRSSVMSFTSDSIAKVCRIKVTVGSPLMNTQAARMEIAGELAARFPQKVTPDQYFEVLTTGRLEPVTERETAEPRYIKLENEQMRSGQMPQALATDTHNLHIGEHMLLTFDPSMRNNDAMMRIVLGHIMQHQQFLPPPNGSAPPLPGEMTATVQSEAFSGGGPGQAPPKMEGAPEFRNSAGETGMPMMPNNPITGQRMGPDGSQGAPGGEQ